MTPLFIGRGEHDGGHRRDACLFTGVQLNTSVQQISGLVGCLKKTFLQATRQICLFLLFIIVNPLFKDSSTCQIKDVVTHFDSKIWPPFSRCLKYYQA